MSYQRAPAVAGRFYPSNSASCLAMVDDLLRGIKVRPASGAVVPHAGWVFSGSTAALGIAAIAAGNPETVVIFGAVHGPDHNAASTHVSGSWLTPLGELRIDAELALRCTQSPLIRDSPLAHRHEHSIEVQLPFLQRLLPAARFVPISVRPGPDAVAIGRFCAREAENCGKRVAFLGSTDLTHYGPAFGFEPHGRGATGIRWAKDVNDRRFIRLIEQLDADAIVPEADANRNACGAGAMAALVAAMKELGARRYDELRHTCSAECESVEDRDPYNSVGYEAGIFCTD